MITFNTHADFERAVMNIIKERLGLNINVSECGGYGKIHYVEVDVKLTDYDTPFNSATSRS